MLTRLSTTNIFYRVTVLWAMERKRRAFVVVLRIKSRFNGIATSKGAHRCTKTLGGTLISSRQAFTKHTTPKWVSHGSHAPISRNPKPTCCQTGNREIKHAEQRQDFTALEQLTSQIQQQVPRVELSPPRLRPEERLRRSDWHTRASMNDNIVENEVVSFFERGRNGKMCWHENWKWSM
jgi:hypothetical protein